MSNHFHNIRGFPILFLASNFPKCLMNSKGPFIFIKINNSKGIYHPQHNCMRLLRDDHIKVGCQVYSFQNVLGYFIPEYYNK